MPKKSYTFSLDDRDIEMLNELTEYYKNRNEIEPNTSQVIRLAILNLYKGMEVSD